jgi:hypothetical protein
MFTLRAVQPSRWRERIARAKEVPTRRIRTCPAPVLASTAAILRSNVAELGDKSSRMDWRPAAIGAVLLVNFGRQGAPRDPAPPAPSPRWGFGGAATPQNRTEDLDVKVFEATAGVSASGSSNRQIIATHCGSWAEQSSCRLEAIARHRDAVPHNCIFDFPSHGCGRFEHPI